MGGSSTWSYWTDYLPWELRNNVGESHTMATTDTYGMWQRRIGKCHMVQEDEIQSQQNGNCSLPRIISKSQTDAYYPMGYSYYWSNNCFSPETRLDVQGQFNPHACKDYHSELDESLNVCYSKSASLQSLAAKSISTMKSDLGLISASSDYSTAELELEWQYIIDSQPKSGLTTPMCELCNKEEDVTFEEEAWCDTKCINVQQRLQQECPFEFEKPELITKRNHEGFLSRQQLSTLNVGVVSQEISKDQDMSSKSSIKSVLWQVVDKEILAKKTIECMENCNLPCPQGRLITKVSTTSLDHSPSIEKQKDVLQNPDRKLLSSLPCESDLRHLESIGQLTPSPSLANLDNDEVELWHSQRLCDPWTISSINGLQIGQRFHNLSSSNKNSQFNGGGVVTMDQGSGLFAEALCHSQTRAREAEKKVQRAFEEKERLMHLFFKEAYLAFTYRQWVTSLQSENMWLRMSPQYQPVAWLHRHVFNPFSTLERLSSKHWKSFGQDCHVEYHRDQNLSTLWHEKALVCLGDPNEIMMGYTLAFALGLSLAGAGLVIGWSMGWILLSY